MIPLCCKFEEVYSLQIIVIVLFFGECSISRGREFFRMALIWEATMFLPNNH